MSGIEFSSAMYAPMLNALPVGILLSNIEGKILFSNSKAEVIFGYNKTELYQANISLLIPERFSKSHQKYMASYMESPSVRAMDHGRILGARNKKGEEMQLELGLSPMKIDNHDYILVSILEASNQVLKIAAFNDPLTGLSNRHLFKELSEELRSLAIRNGVCLSMMFIDLDDFKAINDDFGHDEGDAVLCEVAVILLKSMRKHDVTGRFGGDEFFVCLYGVQNEIDPEIMANSLIEKISLIKGVSNRGYELSASIGVINVINPEAMSIDDMIKMSDKLMYKAKNAGKGRIYYESV